MRLTMRWWAFWGVILAAPMLTFLLLKQNPAWDSSFNNSDFHFYVVSGTALAAMLACVFVISLTESLRETRLLFLGLAFLSIAGIFAVHGLDTPGHIHDVSHAELRVSAWLSVMAGAFFVALSVVTLPEGAGDWIKRYGGRLFCGVATAAGIYIGLSIATPDWLEALPYDNRVVQYLVTAATINFLAFGAWRYFQAFLFARLLSQWVMVIVLVLLMETQVALTWGRTFSLSWWLYHATYAAAFIVLFAGWALEARRAGDLRVISDALSMRDAIAQLSRGHTRQIADLVDAIEWKDTYTLGHVRRVASYAVMTGKELGFSTLELRALALGAQMHDVGKIGVPDRILLKPAALTKEEFEVIKEHVIRGSDIASKTSSLRPVISAIRHHHERWDGSGYPDGLKGEEIPLHARIVSIADAFDAMTSGRAYQPAVSREAAVVELRKQAGSQFDLRCVEAFALALSRVQEPADVRSRGSTVTTLAA